MASSNSLNKNPTARRCEVCKGSGFILENVPRMLLKPAPARELIVLDDIETVKDFLLSLLAPEEFGFAVTEEVRMKVRELLLP